MKKQVEFKVGDKINIISYKTRVTRIEGREIHYTDHKGRDNWFHSSCNLAFKIEEEFTRGEIVQVMDEEDGNWCDRIYLTTIEGSINPIICVSSSSEEEFNEGEEFGMQSWNRIRKKPTEEKVEFTLKVNGKEVDPSTLSEESWNNLRKGKS